MNEQKVAIPTGISVLDRNVVAIPGTLNLIYGDTPLSSLFLQEIALTNLVLNDEMYIQVAEHRCEVWSTIPPSYDVLQPLNLMKISLPLKVKLLLLDGVPDDIRILKELATERDIVIWTSMVRRTHGTDKYESMEIADSVLSVVRETSDLRSIRLSIVKNRYGSMETFYVDFWHLQKEEEKCR